MSKHEKTYSYFDTPDGEDTLKKLWFTTKIVGPLSVGIATLEVMLISHPKGYMATLGRYAYLCGPALGISTAFVLTTNYAAAFRKKQDELNWFIGALPAAGVLGAWRKSGVVGLFGCIGFGLAAVMTKKGIDENWKLCPSAGHINSNGGIWAGKYDFTLTKDRPISSS